MKVLLISHTCQSRTEGQPKAAALAKIAGIDLTVLVPGRWRHYGRWRQAEPPVTTGFRLLVEPVRFPWVPGAQFYLHMYPRLARILEEWQPDVIDLWEEPWALVSAHTCWLRKRLCPGARIVAETEQNIFKTLPTPFENFRNYVHRNADFLVGRSREALAMSRMKGFAGPATMVPNGVDTALFHPLDRVECRRALFGEAAPKFIVGYVGRLVPEKGLDDLLDALLFCEKSVQLALVGDGPMRHALAARATQMGVAERVHFLGAQPLAALPRVMNALDALVLPSRTTARWKEQFGRVLIEAHACGTPVIGSNSGAIPDVVGDGGLIVPECDPRALGGAIQRLAGDGALCVAMGASGRERAIRECSWESVAQQMADIYFRITGRARHGAFPDNASAMASHEMGLPA